MDRRDFLKLGVAAPLLPSIMVNDALAGVIPQSTVMREFIKPILVTGGQGGTGKTLLTGQIAALQVASGQKVTVADLSQKDHFATSFDLETQYPSEAWFRLAEDAGNSSKFDLLHWSKNVIFDGTELNQDLGRLHEHTPNIDVLMVTTADPQSVIAVFKSLKRYGLLSQDKARVGSISLLVNNVVGQPEAESVHRLISKVSKNSMDMEIGLAGWVMRSDSLQQSFRKRQVNREAFAYAAWFNPDGVLSGVWVG